MIEIELSTALFLFTAFPLLVLFIALISIDFRNRKKKSDRTKEPQIWSCSICTHVYVDSKHSDISQCPECGSYNKREDADLENPRDV